MAIDPQDPQGGSPDPSGQTADPSEAPGSAPTIDWDSPDNPYKQRFETYRPEADRRATQLSQYQQAIEDFNSGDPDAMRRAAAILQIDQSLDIPEPGPEYQDPGSLPPELAGLYSKIQEMEGKLTARERADQEAAMDRMIEQRLGAIEDLDPGDHDLVVAQAVNMPLDPQGNPDIQGAYEALKARDQAHIDAAMNKYADSKGSTPIAPGTRAEPAEDIMAMNRDQLRARDQAAIERATLKLQES
jgi:hypothetical protein